MRRILLSGLLVLLCVSLASAGPNAREDSLEAEATIRDLAVAWNGATIGVATDDPESGVAGATAEGRPVWYVWEADGSQIWASHADRTNCATLLEDDCSSNALAFDVNDDGQRFAFASRVEAASVPSSDPARSLVFFGTGAQGVIAQHKSTWLVDFVDVSGSGTRVVVVSHDPTPNADTSRIEIFAWPSPNLADPLVSTDVAGRITGLSVSQDGKEIAFAGDAYYHLAGSAQKTDTTSATTEPASAVHISRDGKWSVVGYEKGTVALYAKQNAGVSKAPVFSRQPGSADVTSVAATSDGTWYAAGDAQGRIHFFEIHNPTGGVPARYTLSVPVSSSAVRELAFSAGGEYLAYRTGGEVHFARWDGKVLTNVWKDERDATALAMDSSGDLLAVAVGSDVVIYDALHFVAGVAPVSPAEPGIPTKVTVTYRNDGNRAETVQLQSSAPSGWTLAPTPTNFQLEPGATTTVDVLISMPDGTAPGTHSLRLNHSLASGASGFTQIDLEVPLVERLILDSVGAPTLNVDPGDAVAFDVRLRNAGNAPRSGTFTLVNRDPTWTASVSPEDYSLAAGQSLDLVVRLEAPAGLADGEGTTVTLRTANVERNLTAIAGAFFDFKFTTPGGVEGETGNATRFDISITNTGNAPDTYTLTSGPLPGGWVVLFENGHTEFDFADVSPSTSVTTAVTVAISADAEAGARHALDLMVGSNSKPELKRTKTLIVTVGEPVGDLCDEGFTYEDGECVKKRGIPGAPLGLVAAGLAAIAARRR